MAVTLTNTDHGAAQVTNGTNTVTISGLSTGAAATDRLIFVGLGFQDPLQTLQADPSLVTIGGVTATHAVTGNLDGLFDPAVYIYWAAVPTGTTASVVVTFPTNAGPGDYIGVSLYRVVGADTTTPVSATASTASHTQTQAVSGSITVPTNGALIATASDISASIIGVNWTNATQDIAFFGVLTSDMYSSASRTTSGTNAITINDPNSAQNPEIAVVALQQAPPSQPLDGAVVISCEGPPPTITRFQYQARAYTALVAPPPSFGWFTAYSEPVRVKPGLPARLQQFYAAEALPLPPPISFNWFYPYSEPVRVKPGLLAALQQSYASETLPLPPPPSFNWFYPYNEPVRTKPGLSAGLQQAFTIGSPPILAPVPSFGYFGAFAEPVRTKPGLLAGLQQSFAYGAVPIAAVVPQFGWFAPYSEPVRVKTGLLARLQQTQAFGRPPITPSMGWVYPFAEPVRLKRGLLSGLQQAYTFGTPPIVVTHTMRLDVTEQGDLFFGVLYGFNAAVRANVSIVENTQTFANMGIVETKP